MTTPELNQETTTEDVKDQEVKQDVADTPKEPEQTKEPEDEAEKNWRAVREKRKEDEIIRKEQTKKIEEQQEMLKAMEALLSKQNQPAQPQNQSEEEEIHPEEWVTGEKLQKILEKDRKERDKLRQQEEQRQTQQRIKSSFPDMDQVLSQDNLAYLEYHEPEIAAGIAQIQDPYLQVANAYKTVKRLVPQVTDQDRKKMERTQNTPGSLSDPRVTSGSAQGTQGNYRPNKLSQQQKSELYKDMLKNSRY